MKHFLKIAEGVDVIPLRLALHRNAQLWNQHTYRKETPGSPHSQMSDIWVRYNDASKYEAMSDFTGFNESHESIWYPSYIALPQLRPIIFGLMARVEGERLGGVFITKIPPGGRIEPHVDTGWHVEYYNTKLYVVLQTNPNCYSRVGDEVVRMQTGEVWCFDNTVEHDIWNDGDDDRITLIVCIRCNR